MYVVVALSLLMLPVYISLLNSPSKYIEGCVRDVSEFHPNDENGPRA